MSSTQRKLLRVVALTGLVGALFGIGWLDVSERSASAQRGADETLQALGRTTGALFAADDARVDEWMHRMRHELRRQGDWTRWGAEEGSDVDPSAADTVGAAQPIDRRLSAALTRALGSSDSIVRLDLVVASDSGLKWMGLPAQPGGVSETRAAGQAKALWYAEAVRRAVTHSGLEMERGELVWMGGADAEADAGSPADEGQDSARESNDRALQQVAIGLHTPGELIQGVLVVQIDLTQRARSVTDLAPPDFSIAILDGAARSLASPGGSAFGSVERTRSLASRVHDGEGPGVIFTADARRVVGVPLGFAGGRDSEFLALIETAAPALGSAAWLSSPWAPALGIALLIAGFGVWAPVAREQAKAGPAKPAHVEDLAVAARRAESASDEVAESAESDAVGSVVLNAELFELRGFLADVRGCLEREAATRGLGMDLRCDRAAPADLISDPAWLGGLVVAMGRDALDATPGTGVLLEVLEDEDDTIRIVVDAAGTELQPESKMQAMAAMLGARLQAGQSGGLSLIVPHEVQ